MSDKCIFQVKLKEESGCLIPIRLQKSTLQITGWECEFNNKEGDCPIVKNYEEYAEQHHNDGCADCDHEGMEDLIRQCAEDAYS